VVADSRAGWRIFSDEETIRAIVMPKGLPKDDGADFRTHFQGHSPCDSLLATYDA
jgi:hypothetical protein